MLWLDKVPSAEIDMTLVGWVTAALVLFHRTAERDSALGWVLALLCVAGGTLTKWTAPAFFYLTVVPLLAWRGELRGFCRLAAPARVRRGGGTCVRCGLSRWREQVGWEALIDTHRKEARVPLRAEVAPRVTRGPSRRTRCSCSPRTCRCRLFALLTFRPSFWAKWDDRGRLLLQLLHCWTWPNLLFWSLVPNHNVRYALPLSPGLMGLGVMGLIGLVRQMGPMCGAACIAVTGIVGFLCCWLVVEGRLRGGRHARREPRSATRCPTAAALREHVPPTSRCTSSASRTRA